MKKEEKVEKISGYYSFFGDLFGHKDNCCVKFIISSKEREEYGEGNV